MLTLKLNPIPKWKLLLLFLLIFPHGSFRNAIVAVVLTHFSLLFLYTCIFYHFLLINFTKVLSVGFAEEFPLDFIINLLYSLDYFPVKMKMIMVLFKIYFLFPLISVLISFFSTMLGFLFYLKLDLQLLIFSLFLF